MCLFSRWGSWCVPILKLEEEGIHHYLPFSLEMSLLSFLLKNAITKLGCLMYDITDRRITGPFFFLMCSFIWFHIFICISAATKFLILVSHWFDPAKLEESACSNAFCSYQWGVVRNTWSPTIAVYMSQVLMHSVPPNNKVYSVDPSVRRKARGTFISEWWQISANLAQKFNS